MRRIRPLLVLALAAAAFLSLRETGRVSACAARGGSYDPATRRCDAIAFQQEPAPRFATRREVVGGAALVALAGAGVAVYLAGRGRRRSPSGSA